MARRYNTSTRGGLTHPSGPPAERDKGAYQLVRKERTCLRCGKPFMSDHAGIRRCDQCAGPKSFAICDAEHW